MPNLCFADIYKCRLAGAPTVGLVCSTSALSPHLCPAGYAELSSLMHRLGVPAVDELLEEVWPGHRDEGTVLDKKPLTGVLRHVKRHTTMAGRQQYYMVQAPAWGKWPLPSGGAVLGGLHMFCSLQIAEQFISLACVRQHLCTGDP